MTFMRFLFFAVLFLVLLPFSAFTQSRTFTEVELMEDITYLQEALYQIHPSPFRYTSKDSMDRNFDALLKKTTSGLTEARFVLEVNELLSSVGCIHTNARRKLKKVKKGTPRSKFIPFEFYTDGDSIWTKRNLLDTFQNLEWKKVLEINGHKTDTILNELMAYHASDGYNTTFMTRLLSRGANLGRLYHSYFGTDSLVNITFHISGQDTLAIIPKLKPASKKNGKTSKEEEKWKFQVKNHFYKEEDNWALLKINSFNPYKRKTRKFYRELFQSLEENDIPNLVIDVRDNLGGSISDANKVLKHIIDEDFVILLERQRAPTFRYSSFGSKIGFIMFTMKRSLECRKKYKSGEKKVAEFKTRTSGKNNYDGKVFVITNGYSASSSSYLATLLKHKSQALIIGEESGGGAAGNNGLYYTTIRLPNSKVEVRIPFYWLDYQLIPDQGRGVMPDVSIPYGIEDLRLEKDLELDWVKQNVGGE